MTDTPQQTSLLHEYLEVQQYNLLLEDQRLDYLYKTYGEKQIPARWGSIKSSTPSQIVSAIEASEGDDQSKKIINYITSFDPTVKRLYAQWLLIRWLKNSCQLEDLPSARQYLEVFDRVKRQLPQKDINQYPTFGDLYVAIRPFLAGETTVAQTKSDKRDAMSQPPQANIIYDDDNIKIVHPMTKAASCYWGRNTRWCTAATGSENYFDRYNEDGPLYIIIDKKKNKRWQFQFSNTDYHSYFMDELDRGIDLKEFLLEYPKVFQVFGEEKFLPMVHTLGIRFFSPKAIKKLSPKQIADCIHSMDDVLVLDKSILTELPHRVHLGRLVQNVEELKYFPEEILKDLHFQIGLVSFSGGENQRAKLLLGLPEDYYKENLESLIRDENEVALVVPDHLITPELRNLAVQHWPKLFELKPEWRTTELAQLAAKSLADAGKYQSIPKIIPSEWRDRKVVGEYWAARVRLDDSLHLSTIPHAYWTQGTIITALCRFPKDMAKHIGVLTEDLIIKMATNRDFNTYFLIEVPKEFCTEALYHAIVEHDETQHFATEYEKSDRRRVVYSKFPTHLWDVETAKTNIGIIRRFSDVNEKVKRDAEFVENFMFEFPAKIKQIGDEYITSKVIEKLFHHFDVRDKVKGVLSILATRNLVSEDTLIKIANTQHTYDTSYYFKRIPKKLYSERVLAAFAKKGAVPIDTLTKPLQTDAIILQRLKDNPSEFDRLPPSFLTSDFAQKAIEKNSHVLFSVPSNLLNENMLWTMLDKAGQYIVTHDKFQKFPKDTWSVRTVAKAIYRHLLPADVKYYEEYPSTEVLEALVSVEPKLFKNFPRELFSKKVIAKIAEGTPEIILRLDPSEINEQIAFAAISKGGSFWKKWRENRTNEYPYWKGSSEKAIFDHIPLSVWSKRIYYSAVGRLVELKDVPKEYRSEEMEKKAVLYRPANITAIPNAAQWLNKVIGSDFGNDDDWLLVMEKFGFIWNPKSGWIDVRDKPKETLSTGYKVSVQSLRTNHRVYIFAPDGEFLFFLYSKKRKVEMPYKALSKQQQIELQPSLKEIIDRYFRGLDIANLNAKTGLYEEDGKIITLDDLPKQPFGALDYTEVEHGKQRRFEFFLNGKSLAVFFTASNNTGWHGKRTYFTIGEINNYAALLEHAKDFGRFVQNWQDASVWSKRLDWQMEDLGINVSQGNYDGIIAYTKIGQIGNLVVYRSENNPPQPERIGIYDISKKQKVVTAKVKKNGGLYNIRMRSNYRREVPDYIRSALERIQRYSQMIKTNPEANLE